MSVSNVWVLHGVLFPAAQFLSHITDASPATNMDSLVEYASGYPDPLLVANRGVNVEVPFSTPQIKTILDLCGAPFAADLSGGNTDLHFKAVANKGVRTADASLAHQRFRMASGFIYWDSIAAAHQQNAVLSGAICPIYNGSAAPLVPAGSLALAGTPAASVVFTLGPVVINGAELAGVTGWRLNMGITLEKLGATGDVYPTFVAIGQRAPVLEVTTLEGSWPSYGIDGTAVSSLVFYLRKKSADGGNVANGTAQHIKFTPTNGKIDVVSTRAAGNTPAEVTLRIPLRATDSSTAIMAIDTASAIS